MIFLRNLLFILAAMLACLSSWHKMTGGELKQCVGGGFETTYFNFAVFIDHFSDDCEDFEKVGMAIQLLIENIAAKIPEYKDEFIEATVCPLPTFAGGRRLGRYRRGTYAFSGFGGCRFCRANESTRQRGRYLAAEKQHTKSFQYFDGREDEKVWFGSDSASRELGGGYTGSEYDSETFEERVCESLVGDAVVDAAVAERAVEKAEVKLNEMLEMTNRKEMKELILMKKIPRAFINEAKKGLEECKNKGAFAKAKALLVEKACESEDFAAVVTTPEEQQGFEMVAKDFEKELQKEYQGS